METVRDFADNPKHTLHIRCVRCKRERSLSGWELLLVIGSPDESFFHTVRKIKCGGCGARWIDSDPRNGIRHVVEIWRSHAGGL